MMKLTKQARVGGLKLASLLAMTTCCAAAWATDRTGLAAVPKHSPETSSLFVDFVDPDGGVPGRMLKPGILAEVQQSTYFVQKCITDDCRFMVVMCLDKEQPGPKVPPRRFAVIDFETDTVTKLEDFRVSPAAATSSTPRRTRSTP